MLSEEIEKLVQNLKIYNQAYRSGKPLIKDAEYDRLIEALRRIAPQHPFLEIIEPEVFKAKRKIEHPEAMLSIAKAYTSKELGLFVTRVEKAAENTGVADICYRVTAKLDGVAGRDDGEMLVTRGDGRFGFDISNAFEKGIIPITGRGKGLGEIVMVQSYFEAHLADKFEHPRNLVVGIIASDRINQSAQKALSSGAVHFVPYDSLSAWNGDAGQLKDGIDQIYAQLLQQIDYPADGLVIQVENFVLKKYMGATNHHYRWQIAFKKKGATALTRVNAIHWQVGRTGNVTPVLEVVAVGLSGATIRRVTAHNAGIVEAEQIGEGATIEIIRSGEVIPKIERVLVPAKSVILPTLCPSCNFRLQREEKFLRCPNADGCRDQIVQRIRHWFHIIGNADWFGVKTIEKLVDAGFDNLDKIYALSASDFESIGFGPVQSRNLVDAALLSRTQKMEDWRFLAAFGIASLGIGESRKLLSNYPLEKVPELTLSDFKKKIADDQSKDDAHKTFKGFGLTKCSAISEGIRNLKVDIKSMLALEFNFYRTPLVTASITSKSPIFGKTIVFSGKMQHGNRNLMQTNARKMGAHVRTAISKSTDILVCGQKAGSKKLDKAKQIGIRILMEDAYHDLVGEPEGDG